MLREFVNAVRGVLRDGDAVIRWGGDEFIAILHNVDRNIAPRLGDRIVEAVRQISIPEIAGERHITTSAGLAFFESTDAGVRDVLERADKAVYEAKEAGRNNCKLFVSER